MNQKKNKIDSISLYNIRNHRKKEIHFDERMNIIAGKNGAGKTNIIESIYLLLTTKSFLTRQYEEIISENQNTAKIEGKYRDDDEQKLRMIIERNNENKRRLYIDEKKVERSLVYIKGHRIICIPPNFYNDIRKQRKVRVNFIDQLIYQNDNQYIETIQKHNEIIEQKRKMLKTGRFDKPLIETYNRMLAETCHQIIRRRKHFTESVSREKGKEKGDKRKETILQYRTFAETSENKQNAEIEIKNIYKKIDKERNMEISMQRPLVGTQNDDYEIMIEGRAGRKYASSGQWKKAVLQLIKAVLQNLEEEGIWPIVAIDDLESEIDEENMKGTIIEIENMTNQIIITSTKNGDEIKKRWRTAKIIEITEDHHES